MNTSEAHGSYRVSVYDRVICLSVVGAWNLQAMLAYLEDFRRTAAPLLVDGRPWATFVDMSDWGLLTPDTIQPFNDAARWAEQNNRTHIALVSQQPEMQTWLNDQLLETTSVTVEFFEQRVEAWKWLMKLGFCAEIPLLIHRD